MNCPKHKRELLDRVTRAVKDAWDQRGEVPFPLYHYEAEFIAEAGSMDDFALWLRAATLKLNMDLAEKNFSEDPEAEKFLKSSDKFVLSFMTAEDFDKLRQAVKQEETAMPLTEKGNEIKNNMEKEYGPKKGEEVFYASKNKGTISGVDAADEGIKPTIPPTTEPFKPDTLDALRRRAGGK